MLRKIAITILTITLVGCSKETNSTPKHDKKVEVVKETEKQEETTPVQLTDVEKAYLEFLDNSLDIYSENVIEIADLIMELEKDPSLVKDKNWNDKLNDSYVMMFMLNRDFNDLDEQGKVPTRYTRVHDIMEECLYYIVKSKEDIPNDVEGAKGLINQSHAKITDLDTEITKISEELGIK